MKWIASCRLITTNETEIETLNSVISKQTVLFCYMNNITKVSSLDDLVCILTTDTFPVIGNDIRFV